MTNRPLAVDPLVALPAAALPAQRSLDWLALLCAGLVFLLPFLVPIHRQPQPVFDTEWAAAVLLALTALVLGARRSRVVVMQVPLPLWLLGMVGIVALQYAGGMLHYRSQLSLACTYAFAIGAAYWIGRVLSADDLRDRFVETIAIAIVIGSLLSFAVQLLQFFNVEGLPEWLVVHIDDAWFRTRPFGNLAQANHLATYLAWGMFAALYLHRRPAKLPLTIVVVLVLAWGLALTRSRMGIIFLLALMAAAWLPSALRPATRRDRTAITLAALIGYVGGSMAVSLWVAYQGLSVDNAIGRFGEIEGITIRLIMWSDALKVAAAHPWLGAGFSQYAAVQYWLAESPGVSANYVHNVVLQTAAELGWPLAVVLCGLVIWWGATQFRRRIGARDTAFAWVLLAILAIHAMLEWPLSSLHYLIPAALLFALGEPRIEAPRAAIRVRSRVLLAAGLVGLALAASMKMEFNEISDVYYNADAERRTNEGLSDNTVRRLIALSEASLLRVYADNMLVGLRKPEAVEASEEEIRRHERVLMVGVDYRTVARLVILEAKAGHIEESVRHAQRLGVFGGKQREAQTRLILQAIEKLGPEADPLRRQLALGIGEPAKAAAR